MRKTKNVEEVKKAPKNDSTGAILSDLLTMLEYIALGMQDIDKKQESLQKGLARVVEYITEERKQAGRK